MWGAYPGTKGPYPDSMWMGKGGGKGPPVMSKGGFSSMGKGPPMKGYPISMQSGKGMMKPSFGPPPPLDPSGMFEQRRKRTVGDRAYDCFSVCGRLLGPGFLRIWSFLHLIVGTIIFFLWFTDDMSLYHHGCCMHDHVDQGETKQSAAMCIGDAYIKTDKSFDVTKCHQQCDKAYPANFENNCSATNFPRRMRDGWQPSTYQGMEVTYERYFYVTEAERENPTYHPSGQSLGPLSSLPAVAAAETITVSPKPAFLCLADTQASVAHTGIGEDRAEAERGLKSGFMVGCGDNVGLLRSKGDDQICSTVDVLPSHT